MRQLLRKFNASFSYTPPPWLRRATSLYLVVFAPVIVGLAIDQMLHPGRESKTTDVVTLILAIVWALGAVGQFGFEWLGWRSKA